MRFQIPFGGVFKCALVGALPVKLEFDGVTGAEYKYALAFCRFLGKISLRKKFLQEKLNFLLTNLSYRYNIIYINYFAYREEFLLWVRSPSSVPAM